MEDLGWKGEAGVKPRSPKGRAVARGLDARIHFQHTFIPAGDTPPKSHQPIKIPLTGSRYLPRPSAHKKERGARFRSSPSFGKIMIAMMCQSSYSIEMSWPV
jgi:hypothetical protein